MEIITKYNPLTGTYEYYNIITHELVGSVEGGGIFDTLASIASKVVSKATSDTAKELAKSVAKTTAKTDLESASKKACDELGKYAVEKITTRPKPTRSVDPNLIVKELQKMDSPVASPAPRRLYRGGREATIRLGRIKKIFKKYNI